jgi:predicted RNase H-like HicB family nuclease
MSDGVHGEVLDFPGALTCGRDLDEARQLLAGALVDMAETNLLVGDNLPVPNASLTDPNADLEEPIHLILNASAKYTVLPELAHETA